jgi:hypothetical protein
MALECIWFGSGSMNIATPLGNNMHGAAYAVVSWQRAGLLRHGSHPIAVEFHVHDSLHD